MAGWLERMQEAYDRAAGYPDIKEQAQADWQQEYGEKYAPQPVVPAVPVAPVAPTVPAGPTRQEIERAAQAKDAYDKLMDEQSQRLTNWTVMQNSANATEPFVMAAEQAGREYDQGLLNWTTLMNSAGWMPGQTEEQKPAPETTADYEEWLKSLAEQGLPTGTYAPRMQGQMMAGHAPPQAPTAPMVNWPAWAAQRQAMEQPQAPTAQTGTYAPGMQGTPIPATAPATPQPNPSDMTLWDLASKGPRESLAPWQNAVGEVVKGNAEPLLRQAVESIVPNPLEMAGKYGDLLVKPSQMVEQQGGKNYLEVANDLAKHPDAYDLTAQPTAVEIYAGAGIAPLGLAPSGKKYLPAGEMGDVVKALAQLPDAERQVAIQNLSQITYSPEANKLQALRDVQAGMPWQQALEKNSDAWREMIGQTVADPLWLLPAPVAEKLFAPINKVLGAGFGALGKGTSTVMKHIPWVRQAELGKQATVFADRTADALGELFGSKAANEDLVAKWGRALAGDFDATLSDKSRKTLETIVPMFEKEFKASAGAGGATDAGDVLASVWKRYKPGGDSRLFEDVPADQMAETLRQAAVNVYRKGIGLAPADTKPGLLARALNWQGSFLKEQWLSVPGFNTAYMFTNTPSDFLRAVTTGHFLNPLDIGAAKKVSKITESLGMSVPRTLDRTLFGSLTERTVQRSLGASEKIPVPLIGRPSEMANIVDALFGTRLKTRPMFNELETKNPLVLLARNLNVGSITNHWGTMVNGLERNARLTMFYNDLKPRLPAIREAVAKAIDGDAGIPAALRAEVAGKLRGFQIKTAQDLAEALGGIERAVPQARIWDYEAKAVVPDEAGTFLNDLSKQLKHLSAPTPEAVSKAFADSRAAAQATVEAAKQAVVQTGQKQAEQVTAGATAHGIKDPNLLTRFTEKLGDLGKGYGSATDGMLRWMEAVHPATKRQGGEGVIRKAFLREYEADTRKAFRPQVNAGEGAEMAVGVGRTTAKAAETAKPVAPAVPKIVQGADMGKPYTTARKLDVDLAQLESDQAKRLDWMSSEEKLRAKASETGMSVDYMRKLGEDNARNTQPLIDELKQFKQTDAYAQMKAREAAAGKAVKWKTTEGPAAPAPSRLPEIPTSLDLSDWSKGLKGAYDSWLRQSLGDKKIPIPDPTKHTDLSALIGDIQSRAAADWRNLVAGKFPATATRPNERTAVEVAQQLLEADKTIYQLSDGKLHLDTRAFQTAQVAGWDKLNPQNKINALLDAGMSVRDAQAFVNRGKGLADVPAGLRAKLDDALARVGQPKAARVPLTPEQQAQIAAGNAASNANWEQLIGGKPITPGDPMGQSYGQWTDEMLRNLNAVIDEWEQQALAKLQATPAPFVGPVQTVARDVVDRHAQALANQLRGAVDNAAFETNKLLFDYSTKGGVEKILSALTPFYKYQTSIIPWAIRTAETHPALPATAVRYGQASATDVQQKNLPPRYRDTMPVPRETSDVIARAWNETFGQLYGKTPVGVDYRVNPKNVLSVVFGIELQQPEQFLEARGNQVFYTTGDVAKTFATPEEAQRYVDNQTRGFTDETPDYIRTLRTLVDGMGALGMRPWPPQQALLYKMGVYGDAMPGDILPWTTAIRAATGARGTPLDLEKALRDWETDGAESKILRYYTAVGLANLVQDGKMSKADAEKAIANPNDPNWLEAQRVAQNSADVRAMIRKFIPMTTRVVDEGEQLLRGKNEDMGTLFDALDQARQSNDLAAITKAKQDITAYYSTHPEMSVFGLRGQAPEQADTRAQTDALISANQAAAQERDAALVALGKRTPIGAKATDEQSAIWDRYNATVARNEKQYPGASFASTAIKAPAENLKTEQSAELRAVTQLEPYWGDGSQWGEDYRKFQAAHDEWAKDPNAVLDRYYAGSASEQRPAGGALTPEMVKAYKQDNDTVDTALNAAYAKWYSERYSAVEGAVAAQRGVGKPEERYARALQEQQYGEWPSQAEFIASIKAEYGDKFSDAEIRARLSERGMLTATEKAGLNQTPEDKQANAVWSAVNAIPRGMNDKYAEDLNAEMKRQGFTGKDYAQLWYDTGGKGLKPDELAAMEKASAAVVAANKWTTKGIPQLQGEIKGAHRDVDMKAEIDAVRARYKGVEGHQAELEIKQIENKYGGPAWQGYYQDEPSKLVDQAHKTIARIPPGASTEFWGALGAEINKTLKAQALANGEKYYGDSAMWSDSDFWYTFDPKSMGDKLRPVVEAMQRVSAKFGLIEPSEETLKVWVEAEKGRAVFFDTQPTNILETQDGYYALKKEPTKQKEASAFLKAHPEITKYWDDLHKWQVDPANKVAVWFYYPDVYVKTWGTTPPTANWQGGPLVTTTAPTEPAAPKAPWTERKHWPGTANRPPSTPNPVKLPYGQSQDNQLRSAIEQVGITDSQAFSLLKMYFQYDPATRDQLFVSYPMLAWWIQKLGVRAIASLTKMFQSQVKEAAWQAAHPKTTYATTTTNPTTNIANRYHQVQKRGTYA